MTPSSTIMDPSHQTHNKSGCEAGCCCFMESLGSAVLSLGQQQQVVPPPPFLEEEEEEDVFPWKGEERRRNSLLGSSSSSHEEPKEDKEGAIDGGKSFALEPNNKEEEEGGGEGEALLELRRRQGRSFSLPSSSPSLAFQGAKEEEDFLEEDHAQEPSCCTKCKKRVQFADSLGLCLASVKHFSSAEEPQVPPAVLSRLQSFPMRRKDLEDFIMAAGQLNAGSCSSFNKSISSADVAMAPPVATLGMTTMAPPQTALRLEPRRRPQGPQEEEEAMVSLEEVSGTAVSGAPSDVRGVVRVQKCPGHKEVTVRYTFNEWLSFLDASAALDDNDGHDDNDDNNKAPFDSSSPSSEKYRFALSLPPGLDRGTAVRFAICYRSHRGEFWDNNGGANYTLFP